MRVDKANYKDFEYLYSTYAGQGLEILAFPCNQFASQEPGTNAEIQEFAKSHGAKYPVFAKIEVNGPNTHPLYQFLKSARKGTLGADIKWNFAKFLVNEDGLPVKRYAPGTLSTSKYEKDIKALLNSSSSRL
eukprot:CAMPEP_0117755476 /NCGR_PEP_ID=MMETSP0947-20121206/13476_1 /TAXON_ID=44440 /ORGANISM="Chattonella subsalsa, Strain CCMP2191" /LENGTH=131 /DNA_ID=CAMNT_0005574821 /DNA_START=241 /DNA_END=637 /DNA_ORIENTATION=+